ncbi:MAG: ABC transporter permease [Sphingobacteriaceae bacterium]
MILLKLIRESFLFAFDALRQNKLRTILSLLGITIGIFTIITVFSAVDTLRNNLQEGVNKLGSNSIFIQKWPWVFGGDYPWWKYFQRPVPNLHDYEQLRDRSETAGGISFEVSLSDRTIKYGSNSVEGVSIKAASHDYYKTWNFDFSDGRYFTENESRTGTTIAIVGYDVADGLDPNSSLVGKTIKIMGRNILVIGVFAKEGEDMLGISADKTILLPLNFVRNLVDIRSDRYDPQIVVRGKEGISVDEVESELQGLMRSIRRLRPTEEDDFALNKATILSNQLDVLFGIVNIAGFIIGGFSILVGGFGIANIMFVSVKERTHIIGIQKSLGAKNYFILLQFLIESIALCVLGGIIGLLLVFLGTYIVKIIFDVNVILDIGNISFGISLSIVIGIISGIIPAYFASKLDPVEAIRSN